MINLKASPPFLASLGMPSYCKGLGTAKANKPQDHFVEERGRGPSLVAIVAQESEQERAFRAHHKGAADEGSDSPEAVLLGDAADLSNWVNCAGGGGANGGHTVEGQQSSVDVFADGLFECGCVKGIIVLRRGRDDAHVGRPRHHACLLDGAVRLQGGHTTIQPKGTHNSQTVHAKKQLGVRHRRPLLTDT